MSYSLEPLVEAIKAGKRKDAKRVTQEAVDANVEPQCILDALTVGMDDVGRRFKANDIFVPEVLVSARAMKTAMKILEPLLVASGVTPEHKIIIGTVEGDLHDIGKNLVAMMLKGARFEVIDMGTDVTAQDFIAKAKETEASIICLSALLTTTMPAMKETVDLIKQEGLDVQVMVGGAPVTKAFCDEIGADGFSEDAGSAVDTARALVA